MPHLPMPDATLIEVRDLTKTYGGKLFKKGFRALDGVSISVGPGSVFGLLGPNGAGKTTLVKILLGLAHPSTGEARLFGEPVGAVAPRARIGYLPEAHRLPLYLTGRQVLELFGQMCGRDLDWVKARVARLLELVDMTGAADRKVREYSKGMQQRIGLAQALIHDPDLVILDEPTDGVDPVGRAAIREVVLDLKRAGKTIFINSHLLMEVELVCDRVVIMDKGRIVKQGTIGELTPRTGRVRFELAPVPPNLETILAGVGSGLVLQEQGCELHANDAEIDVAVDRLRAAGVSIRGLEARRMNLEQAFIETVTKERA
ncbi:MAG: ABC transporter ATP-binding protein [Planctomycetes bacterium]|nr:ABC transporter ATP-binding protein [Planctomycetota bacterium]